MKKRKPKFLDFHHRKLTKKAKTYQHEVGHLTDDCQKIVRKIYRQQSICEGIIKTISDESNFLTQDPGDDFEELLYHIENFNYRLYSYRDKVCIFINHVMRFGYSDTDTGLLDKLIENNVVKDFHIDTELKKFKMDEFSELLGKRKSMTHRVYYESYNPHFLPKINPKEVGKYKAGLAWKKETKKEVSKIKTCMEKMFNLNNTLTEKLIKYLNT